MRNTTRRLALAAAGLAVTAQAGPKLTFNEGQSDLELTQTYQVWLLGTNPKDNLPKTDPRADLFLKQGRLGLKGHVIPGLSYSTLFAFDNLGKDFFTGSIGAPQPSNNATFLLYDFYMTYGLDTNLANITFGYFRPQTGHENIAPDAGVSSFDKALTSPYLREAEVGRTSGRETGANIGGFYGRDLWAVAYNAGAFDPNHEKIAGVGTGTAGATPGPRHFSPLLTGRLAVSLGDPDMPGYRLSPELNAFGKRKGITIGGHYAYQGQTDETWDTAGVKYTAATATKPFAAGKAKYIGGFQRNATTGIDVVANFLGLNLDGEFDLLKRKLDGASFRGDSIVGAAADYTDKVWHVRAGYDIPLPNGQFVEPTVMYSQFDGDDASAFYPGGQDKIIDGGVNWYVNKNNLKLTLHYWHQDGKPKSMYQAAAASATSLTRRGDFAGANFQFSF